MTRLIVLLALIAVLSASEVPAAQVQRSKSLVADATTVDALFQYVHRSSAHDQSDWHRRSMREARARPNDLPLPISSPEKPILALDLDGTLISQSKKRIKSYPPNFFITRPNGFLYIYKRPGVDEFLRAMARHYTLVLFTHSEMSYADSIVNKLDPLGVLFSARLYRHSCGQTSKDLTCVTDSLTKVILVDDSPYNLQSNPTNGFLVTSWNPKNALDTELKLLAKYLTSIAHSQDLSGKNAKWRKIRKSLLFYHFLNFFKLANPLRK